MSLCSLSTGDLRLRGTRMGGSTCSITIRVVCCIRFRVKHSRSGSEMYWRLAVLMMSSDRTRQARPSRGFLSGRETACRGG